MEKKLKKFIGSLQSKYNAEKELHEEIDSKLQEKLTLMLHSNQDLAGLHEAMLKMVEETYVRMLKTKRTIQNAQDAISESAKKTEKHLNKLYQIQKDVESMKKKALHKLMQNNNIQKKPSNRMATITTPAANHADLLKTLLSVEPEFGLN